MHVLTPKDVNRDLRLHRWAHVQECCRLSAELDEQTLQEKLCFIRNGAAAHILRDSPLPRLRTPHTRLAPST